jgi:predicted MFS family arabinose efflux permease
VFGSLLTVVFLLGLSRVAFAPLVAPLMSAFTVGEGTIGVVLTLVWGGTAVSAVPAGYLLTRVGRRPMILCCGVLLGGANVLVSVAHTIEVLALGTLLLGLSAGGYFAAVNPFLAALYPEQVGRAVGLHGMSHQAASTLAPVVVTAVLAVGSWRTTFVTVGVAVLVATGLFVALGRHVESGGGDDPSKASFLTSVRSQWRVVAAGVGMAGATMFVWMGVFNFYVPYLSSVKSLPGARANLLLSLAFAAGVPAFWVSGRLADRVRKVPLVLAVVATFAALIGVLPLVAGFWPLAAISVALGFVVHALFPALDSYLLTSVPDENRASAYALLLGVTIAVEAPGSVVLGSLVARGVAYDTVFRFAASGLGAVFCCLLVAYVLDWIPE